VDVCRVGAGLDVPLPASIAGKLWRILKGLKSIRREPTPVRKLERIAPPDWMDRMAATEKYLGASPGRNYRRKYGSAPLNSSQVPDRENVLTD